MSEVQLVERGPTPTWTQTATERDPGAKTLTFMYSTGSVVIHQGFSFECPLEVALGVSVALVVIPFFLAVRYSRGNSQVAEVRGGLGEPPN